MRAISSWARLFPGAGTGSNSSAESACNAGSPSSGEGRFPAATSARALPDANAARLVSTALPLFLMACSHASAGKGRAPEPAKAPRTTELITLPLCRARASMSSATSRFAVARATCMTVSLSASPSPSADFSPIVNTRWVDVTSVVRSRLTNPRCMARPASINSEATIRSTSPGLGISARIGCAPAASAEARGKNSR